MRCERQLPCNDKSKTMYSSSTGIDMMLQSRGKDRAAGQRAQRFCWMVPIILIGMVGPSEEEEEEEERRKKGVLGQSEESRRSYSTEYSSNVYTRGVAYKSCQIALPKVACTDKTIPSDDKCGYHNYHYS